MLNTEKNYQQNIRTRINRVDLVALSKCLPIERYIALSQSASRQPPAKLTTTTAVTIMAYVCLFVCVFFMIFFVVLSVCIENLIDFLFTHHVMES